jgi:hypothetical protein
MTNVHASLRIIMHRSSALNSADPVDLGAQSDLIGAPEPMSIEAALTAQADIAHRSKAGGDAP